MGDMSNLNHNRNHERGGSDPNGGEEERGQLNACNRKANGGH